MARARMSSYMPPTQWKRIDAWRAKAADGSLAWMDMRGLVGLQQPGGLYIRLGASSSGANGELHDGKYNPPSKRKAIRVFIAGMQRWWMRGYQTKEGISAELRKAILDSLEKAMKSLGYSVKYVQSGFRTGNLGK